MCFLHTGYKIVILHLVLLSFLNGFANKVVLAGRRDEKTQMLVGY